MGALSHIIVDSMSISRVCYTSNFHTNYKLEMITIMTNVSTFEGIPSAKYLF